MPKEQTKSHGRKPPPKSDEIFGPSLSESLSNAQQNKKARSSNSTSTTNTTNTATTTTAKKTKWTPFPVEIKTAPGSSSNNNTQKPPGRNRRRRKGKAASSGASRSVCHRKPAPSPSLVSTCSSNSISSGIGSVGSSALAHLNDTSGTHDAISTPTLPSSGCSSIGFSDDKYEDNPLLGDLASERDCSEATEDPEPSPEPSSTKDEEIDNPTGSVAAVSVGFITENFVKPDLTNPVVQQFYEEQRLIYRRIYERHFATMASIPCSMAFNSTYHALSTQFNDHCHIEPRNKINNGRFRRPKPTHDKSKSSLASNRKSSSASNGPVKLSDLEVSQKATVSKSHKESVRESRTQPSLATEPSCSEQLEQQQEGGDCCTRIDQAAHSSSKEMKDNCPPNRNSLSAQIYEFQKSTEQSASSLCEKLYLRDLLYSAISPHFSGCGLYIIGSTLNGFGSGSSDMDLCLMITPRDLDQRVDAVVVLSTVMGHLKAIPLVKNMDLIFAKVPILRATFNAPFDKITIDLNANNSVAIRNTHLLVHYSGFDWRVRPLVCVIKEWAKRRGINNANQSSLTSYSLVLMVIHYLQVGVSPPILPSLQQLYPNRFNPKLDVRSLDIAYPLEIMPGWDFARNFLPLGDLLRGFFRYYAYDFDFDSSAISIRLGQKVDRAFVVRNRSPHNSYSQWRCICIEEPFVMSNAAHSVYDERIFETIKKAFEVAYKELENGGTVESLLSDLTQQPHD